MPAASGCGGIGWWWAWDDGGGVKKSIHSSATKNGHHNNGERACVLSSAFAYFLFSFVVLGSIGSLYARFMGTANVRAGMTTLGCQEDSEGSWAIGIFYGDSPFTLKPIEAMNVWKNQTAAWPVANPVVTCASLSGAGFPSNFVADPFLYVKDDILYLFFETKNTITMQGDIGVALSLDKGATWQQLGIALDEDWHLSYPYIFEYNGIIYMMPEGSSKGDLRLYRAINFPLEWTFDKIIMKRPLVDSFMIPHEGKFWLFGSDHSQIGSRKNGHLEIWYSHSPFGPWRPHKMNPVYNTGRSTGARNGGRPFVFNGSLYRVGQDCGQTYGHHIRIFKLLTLTTDKFREAEVPSGLDLPVKGQKKWNTARAHHLDVRQLGSGGWVAVLDGDRVLSGDPTRRFLLGSVLAVTLFATILFGAVIGKRSDNTSNNSVNNFTTLRPNRARSRLRLRTCCTGIFVLILILAAVILTFAAVTRIYGRGTDEPYSLGGDYSQFTLVMMSSHLPNLKMLVRRYSRCASVREIVIVCDKGEQASNFDSAVPIRVRNDEGQNRSDPLLETRAVLELDDDIMMTCDDIERGFRVWREHPDKMVGFYPRRDNSILTGAAFVDRSVLGRYWGEEHFNCEDLLMYANLSGRGRGVVEYVRRPPWVVVDTYKIFRMANIRNKCLAKFDGIYGSLSGRKVKFGIRRTDGTSPLHALGTCPLLLCSSPLLHLRPAAALLEPCSTESGLGALFSASFEDFRKFGRSWHSLLRHLSD
ncbi:Glycosyltransferase family protein 64 protein C5 [Striga hermonthica]|uniref:Glycosyltransferase family protein 64 protein C5 n=1 Tax=Striga hermonthica TaxID=68872 RepID=A0A9N7MRT8_STRHE|nr:Glycosyltransferase family protein 64 protein C5 [Striga hermonthica]